MTTLTPAARPRSVAGLPERDRCLVMGVLNVTPDSFSDGGRFLRTSQAIAHGMALAAAGADIVDVGGESTRPGAQRVSVAEELARVVPVVRELAAAGLVVSIDTTRAEVARAAVDAGAGMINDVSGGLADPGMAGYVASSVLPYIAMHWRGHSLGMQQRARYRDVVADVTAELRQRLSALAGAGVDPGQIMLDPGLGFAKTAEHNWALLSHLGQLQALGHPIVIGASRKSFLGALSSGAGRPSAPGTVRDAATAAVSALAAAAGAYCVRVHDVALTLDAVRVAAAWTAARGPAGSTAGITTGSFDKS